MPMKTKMYDEINVDENEDEDDDDNTYEMLLLKVA
jgi:hypothetical protein